MATKSSNWMVMVSGFFEPVLYLISMGVGLGAIVGSVQGPGGQEIATPPTSRRRCWRCPP